MDRPPTIGIDILGCWRWPKAGGGSVQAAPDNLSAGIARYIFLT